MRALPGLVRLDGTLPEFLSANAHAFTRAELRQTWTRTALESAVRSKAAMRILPGIYCAREHATHPQVRGEAINLWHPAGLVTGRLALHLYRQHLPPPQQCHLRVSNGYRPQTPGWITCIQGAPVEVSGGPGGIRCVVPEVALLDAWRFAPAHERRKVLWEALWAGACTWRQLERELDRTPRLVGRRELERLLGWFAEGVTSPLEARAKHEVFTGARFRDLEWQVELVTPHRRARVDVLHRRAMVIVELDGDAYHSTRRARDEDRNRQTDLVAAGFAVIRFGWRDIVDRPEWCRERVLTVVAGRLARASGN